MKHFKKSRAAFPVIAAVLLTAFYVVPLHAQQAMTVSGTMTAQYTKDEPFNIDNTKNHMVDLAISEGTNQSTGDQKFMDGAQISNVGFSDLTEGNGNQQGYVTFANGADTTIAKWEGKVTTASSAQASADPQFEGTFTWIYGSGKFKNISGKGTYNGQFTAKNQYQVEWKGTSTTGK